MNNECSIVRDLLPLCAEDMVAPETADFVAAHVASCPDCEKEYAALKSGAAPSPALPEAEKAPLKSIKKAIIKKRVSAVILAVVLAAALLVTAFAFLTTPEYLSYDEAIAGITPGVANMSAEVEFNECVTGYNYTFTYAPETDADDSETNGWVCRLEAWTTPWDRLFRRGVSSVSIARNADFDSNAIVIINNPDIILSFSEEVDVNSIGDGGFVLWKASDEDGASLSDQAAFLITAKPFSLYYTPNDGTEDVFAFGVNRAGGGAVSLPRLVLNYYFCGAAGLLALLIIAGVIFRRNETARKWLARAAFLPLSYAAAHLIVKGFDGTSYAIMRDFTLILLIAVLFFCAMLVAHNIFLLKRDESRIA
ncbi:MAG: zf-HC2 domain-containing protein [Clostridia bacterium]|nr:zf-HC2 domain-containing protein [Clostridia bacterium]